MTTPYLLYPSAFLTPWGASAVMNDLDSIAKPEVANLKEGAINLYNNPSAFTDFQKVIFNANYDVRLQPFGYADLNRNLGVDLYNELSAEQDYWIEPIKDEDDQPLAYYVIQPINVKKHSIDLNRLNSPIIYISSPYSVAKAISNIANKGDRPQYSGGYMISYPEKAGYQSVISGQIPGRENKITTQTFYPLPHDNNLRSIQLNTGKDNDFILFDNSHSEIHLSDGDDTAAPSAAAFSPSVQFGHNIINAISDDSTKTTKSITNFPFNSEELTDYSTAGEPFRLGSIDYDSNTASPQKEISIAFNGYASDVPPDQKNFSARTQYLYASKTDITDAEQDQTTINIGGQSIYGQSGNDVLYGFDPLLYAGLSAQETASSNSANGPLSLKFLNNAKTNINWTPILLSGGKDQDTFILGDLSKINLRNGKINSSDRNGSTFYTLLGDKNTLGDVSLYARQQQSWGEGLSADTYMLAASYDYTEEVIQKAINLDYSIGNNIDRSGAAQNARNTAKSVLDLVKVFKKALPELEVIVAVAKLGIDIAASSKPNPATVSKFYRDEVKQKVVPPSSWNQTINVPDWDPLDRFVIQTIPIEDPSVVQAEAWSNVNFSIRRENNLTMTPQNYGYTVEMETAVGGKKPIAYLTGLQSPNDGAEYGYKTYNFFTGRETKIDPIKDITYFGVLANSEKVNNIKISYREKEYRDLQIDKDDSLFLWNSEALREAGFLNQYRSAASSIQIGVDTRRFGWYTDLKLKEGSTSEIDLYTSTFNQWDRNQNKWISVRLEKLASIDSTTLAAKNAAKARFTYWTAQDTYGNQLMNLAAADAVNSNDLEFYKSRDDGSVLDPVTGTWLAPGAEGYEQAALSDQNYARAFSVKQSENGSLDFIVDEGMKLSPFIETVFPDGRIDYIFAYNEVHSNDPNHSRDSMVLVDDSGILRFEDVIGGDYDYNDAILDPNLNPMLAKYLAADLLNLSKTIA